MSNRRPHRVNDKCYIRIGASNRVATPDEEFELMRRTGQMPYDLSPIRSAGVSDLDLYSFMDDYLPKRVSNDVLMENGRKPEEWLIHLRLAYREGEKIIPTVAAILLFGKAPQQFLPHANIDFIRFEGLDKSYPIVDRKHINGTLKQQIESAVQLVERYTIQGYHFSNDSPIRKDTVEYPLRAIREVVANAIVHRDYEYPNASVSLEMFDDRIEVRSPGGLFGIVSRENFGTGINDYRNPTLAVGLNIQGLVEKAGTGILQIKRQMRENGSVAPNFDIGDRYLISSLPAHPYYHGVRSYQKGLQLLSAEHANIGEAILHFKKAVELFPSLAEAWAALGRAYQQEDRLEEMREAYSNAIRYSPKFERAYIDWGNAERLAGDLKRAKMIYTQGLQAIPKSAQLLKSAGLLAKQQREWKESLQYLKLAAQFDMNNEPNLLHELGEVSMGLHRWEDASLYFQQAIDQSAEGESTHSFLWLMKALINMEDTSPRIDNCFETAIKTGFKAHELFSVYYRYLTQHDRHADALRVKGKANELGLPSLTPYSITVNVSGLPIDSAENLKENLTDILNSNQINYSKIQAIPIKNTNPRRHYATIRASNNANADKIIAALNGFQMGNSTLVARFHNRKI